MISNTARKDRWHMYYQKGKKGKELPSVPCHSIRWGQREVFLYASFL